MYSPILKLCILSSTISAWFESLGIAPVTVNCVSTCLYTFQSCPSKVTQI